MNYHYSLDTFRKNLKLIRKSKGVSLKELARQSGTYDSFIVNVESGKKGQQFPADLLFKFCEVLDVKVEDLLREGE